LRFIGASISAVSSKDVSGITQVKEYKKGRIYEVNKIKGVGATSQCHGGCKGTELRVIDNRHLFAKGPNDVGRHERCILSAGGPKKDETWDKQRKSRLRCLIFSVKP
jgi:hypothetical protein